MIDMGFLFFFFLVYGLFRFIIIDGNGALFRVLQGNAKTVFTKFLVHLPKKQTVCN
jgi:peptide subunit release factor 1 (eRF1)